MRIIKPGRSFTSFEIPAHQPTCKSQLICVSFNEFLGIVQDITILQIININQKQMLQME